MHALATGTPRQLLTQLPPCQGYSNVSVILDWNEAVQKTIFASAPNAPSTGKLFSGSFQEQPLALPAAARVAALLNVVLYETILLFTANASQSAFDPFNADGSCPPRVLAVNASAVCPRYVAMKDLGNGVPALAASYGAHYLLTQLFPLKAGSGGSSVTNLRFDNLRARPHRCLLLAAFACFLALTTTRPFLVRLQCACSQEPPAVVQPAVVQG